MSELNSEVLEKLGFEKIFVDYWRRDDFGISQLTDGRFIYSRAGFHPDLKTIQQLKELFKKRKR